MKFKTKDGNIYEVMDERVNDMTRDEAIEKFHEIMYPETYKGDGFVNAVKFDKDRAWAKKAIAAYEALGLIKFDEPELGPMFDVGPFKHLSLNAISLMLYEAGYKVVKKDTIKVVPASRPVDWDHLKRDLDQMARDVLASHNPTAMREAITNFKYLIAELDGQE